MGLVICDSHGSSSILHHGTCSTDHRSAVDQQQTLRHHAEDHTKQGKTLKKMVSQCCKALFALQYVPLILWEETVHTSGAVHQSGFI